MPWVGLLKLHHAGALSKFLKVADRSLPKTLLRLTSSQLIRQRQEKSERKSMACFSSFYHLEHAEEFYLVPEA